MLSFLAQQLSSAEDAPCDSTTSGDSAYVYMGGHTVQIPEDTTRIRVDKSVHLDGRVKYGHIFSLELPPSTIRMDVNMTRGTSCLGPSKIIQAIQTAVADSSKKANDVFKHEDMKSLRNVAFPSQLSDKDLPTFDTSSDLGRVLPSRRNSDYLYRMLCNGYSLRNRFDGLPLHRICYYHSYDTAEVAIRGLMNELEQSSSRQRGQDCLGMTPLHILACSTNHHLDMYQMLLSRHPEYLITKDAWGDMPLMYVLWGRAPRGIVCLLTQSMQTYYPDVQVDWAKMCETLCAATAPIACIEYLIETSSAFPNSELQLLNWDHMVRTLCTKAKASEEHVQSFISLYQNFFPDNDSDLERLSVEVATVVKFGFKPFWLKIGISNRLVSLEKKEWREQLESLIRTCPTGSSVKNLQKRVDLMESILRKLAYYETKEKMWELELALWKAKIEESNPSCESTNYRSQSQITCGADIVIPNVMSYLIPLWVISGKSREN
mmetsp:Transcript_27228/g.58357  ORF Transcript_27228/g.58357 Transcript_27228/m.58357 type:complete len:490 (-) Transcript_27228:298-1767(-)|eukprot:CAMPEP_0172301772 /NCGR_PEP_ID=MMETSP1058-20130122/3592_1 /TAXON_ID=83371 /ORGANISM="Detonula confervacea, Strain CCMP 353" /LENGTH=489 /DNA_ID=CAMNT_0013012023 /DNA_START=69 /DNA_END=1538 /DNA_ORIENTATION=+